MNMDFVQRNLINERNNLQIELAKAKALIAQLSEAYPYSENKYPEQHSEIEQRKNVSNNSHPKTVSDNKQGVSSLAAKRKQQARDASFKKPMSEQAEYISDLENIIATIAEQLGVHPNDLLNEYNINEARVMTSRGVRRQRKFTTVESRRKEAEDKLVKNPNERQDETAGLVPVSAAHNAAYAAVRAHGGINSDKLNTDMNALKSHEFARKHAITDAKRRQLDRVSGLSGLRGQQEKQMAKRKDPVFTRDLENYIGSTTPNKFRKDSVETMIKNKYNPLTKTKLKPGNILDISKNRSELFKNINKKK